MTRLAFLADEYDVRHRCHDIAQAQSKKLRELSIADIFETGLHEFLSDFIRANARLGDQIMNDYRFH
jgi:uncharacterized alpha-E superfamily protein